MAGKRARDDGDAEAGDVGGFLDAARRSREDAGEGASFEALGVGSWLAETCAEMGIRKPTEIQRRCIPRVLRGEDVIGRARTGSGKTAAFALPILQALSVDPYGVFAMVLTPTRELAYQIADQFRAFGVPVNLRDAVVIGGMEITRQAVELEGRPHVVIATPGRLAELLRGGTRPHLKHLRFLVLDEADRLFEPCFAADMETILAALPPPEKRQTLLFSATITRSLVRLQEMAMTDPVFCEASSSSHDTVRQLTQQYLFQPQNVKECYLAHVLLDARPDDTAIVFVSTCRGCEVVAEFLQIVGVECEALHSKKNQARRMASLGKFRSGRARVLVATDVASRGLDIPTVRLVVNYDVPRVVDDYVHRVGRTARAGRAGLALTFVSQYDVRLFKQIEGHTGVEMTEFDAPERRVLERLKEVNAAKRMAKIHLEEWEAVAEDRGGARRRRPHGRGGGAAAASSSASSASASAGAGKPRKKSKK